MICDFEHTIKKYDMIKKGETVAVGVSGGADSVCLLHFLSKIMGQYDITVKAVHINHNIRGDEAKRDEIFVKELCQRLGVEFICFSVDVPKKAKELSMGTEECARKLRYECFEKVEADKIATAHTLSDSAETVIFNLARGTGLKGACGILPKRGKIIRPLIGHTRSDIELYCKENGLSFVTDSTNLSDDYTRNKIRHNVVPALKELNNSFEKSISRFCETATAENDFLEKSAVELLENAEEQNRFNRGILISSHEAVLRRAVAALLGGKMAKDTEQRHIELCIDVIKNGRGSVEISKGLFFEADKNYVCFHHRQNNAAEDLEWEVKAQIGIVHTPFGKYEISLAEKSETDTTDIYSFVDADGLEIDKLVIRSRKSGDKFTSIKRKNTKTLKKIFIENKIPADQRHRKGVLCFDDRILWVETLGTNAKYIVKDETKTVLIIKPVE